jgi:tetratricopeptide (TPR) repeat protein
MVWGICISLAILVWALYAQTLRFDFVNFDDDLYVTDNPEVINGLTGQGITHIFTHSECKFYHPLAMLSLMLDRHLYGLNPAGFHFTNVLFHTASVILLFLVLRSMTGALWRSAFVAAVFAIHPLRAESVAWVAERKDVLSVFFFMLTLGSYVRYTRAPSMGRYLALVIIYILGLLSKPSLMTLPFVLLLLDYWPLGRLQPAAPPNIRRLILEKIPLLVVAVAAAIVAVHAEAEVVRPVSQYPIPARICNAAVSYATYLWQSVYPTDLAAFYPHPGNTLPAAAVALSFLVLVIISALAIWRWKQRPYLIVGWLWYLGMLVPMIGLVQVGAFAHADRFTYLPQIGLLLGAAWAVADVSSAWRARPVALGIAAADVIITLATFSFIQISYWRNSDSLWTHVLACTRNNAVAEAGYSDVLLKQGDNSGAMTHAQKALAIEPDFEVPRNNLGVVLFERGQVDDAIANYRLALAGHPDYEPALYNLGKALLQQGHWDEAIATLQKALLLKPTDAPAANNYGIALLQQGRVADAIARFQDALKYKPDYAPAWKNLGLAFQQQGQMDDAIATFRKSVELWPGDAEAWYDLGNALLQKNREDDAINAYQKCLAAHADYPEAHYNLGSAFLLKGSFDEAIGQYQKYLASRPDDVNAHNHLGYALLQKGRPTEAIPEFEKFLATNPNRADTQDELGKALEQTGQLDQAIQHYRQALTSQPDFADAQTNLNHALQLQNK